MNELDSFHDIITIHNCIGAIGGIEALMLKLLWETAEDFLVDFGWNFNICMYFLEKLR